MLVFYNKITPRFFAPPTVRWEMRCTNGGGRGQLQVSVVARGNDNTRGFNKRDSVQWRRGFVYYIIILVTIRHFWWRLLFHLCKSRRLRRVEDVIINPKMRIGRLLLCIYDEKSKSPGTCSPRQTMSRYALRRRWRQRGAAAWQLAILIIIIIIVVGREKRVRSAVTKRNRRRRKKKSENTRSLLI